MFPFDVILFDVGGVLLTNGWDHRERAAVVEQFHLDRAALEARHAAPYRRVGAGRDYCWTNILMRLVFYEPRSFTREEFFAAHLRAIGVSCLMALWASLKELAASDKCMRWGLE